jgi:penicillin-binding protein 2
VEDRHVKWLQTSWLGARPINTAQAEFSFSRRAIVLGGAQLSLGGLLAGRMAWISVFENERYALLAESNRVNLSLIPPRRGWIVDRAGKPLALNRTIFRVDIIPDRLKDKRATLDALQVILRLTPDERDRIEREVTASQGYQPVQVAENIDLERYAAVSIRAPDLPGVQPAQGFARYYPEGPAVAHLLGYVGAASAKDYEKSKDPLLITPGFKVGKDGIEKTVEPMLRGQPGARRSEVTARGKLVRDLATRPDVVGQTARLTIDAGLQAYAARRLGENSGAVTVIDLATGGVLAMASMPAYDPNSFSDGIGRQEWRSLSDDERHPLINKALQSLYPPGSTLKPVAALALLKAGVTPEDTVFCSGGYRLGNRTFRCLGRHGTVGMKRAIAKSCNTYFYSMGRRIGYDAIAVMARELGLGMEFDLPLPSQRYGTIPDSAWKMRKYNQSWSDSDTLNATIGQGYVIVSPFQLAVMAARVASGRSLQPHLMGRAAPGAPLSCAPEHLAFVRAAMSEVVNGDGTAGRSRLPLEGIQMGGKTGTAQVRKIAGTQRGQSGAWKYRDHGLFVCFAPVDNPRYAASVVIEHGMGGARAAAPVARDVLTYLFDPAKAMGFLAEMETGLGGDLLTRTAARAALYGVPAPVPTIETSGDATE